MTYPLGSEPPPQIVISTPGYAVVSVNVRVHRSSLSSIVSSPATAAGAAPSRHQRMLSNDVIKQALNQQQHLPSASSSPSSSMNSSELKHEDETLNNDQNNRENCVYKEGVCDDEDDKEEEEQWIIHTPRTHIGRLSLSRTQTIEKFSTMVLFLVTITFISSYAIAGMFARLALDPSDQINRFWQLPIEAFAQFLFLGLVASLWYFAGMLHLSKRTQACIVCMWCVIMANEIALIYNSPLINSSHVKWNACASTWAKVNFIGQWLIRNCSRLIFFPVLSLGGVWIWTPKKASITLWAWVSELLWTFSLVLWVVWSISSIRAAQFPVVVILCFVALYRDTRTGIARHVAWRSNKGYVLALSSATTGIQSTMVVAFLSFLVASEHNPAIQAVVIFIYQILTTVILFVIRTMARRALPQRHVMMFTFSILLLDDMFGEMVFTVLDPGSIVFWLALAIQYSRVLLRDTGMLSQISEWCVNLFCKHRCLPTHHENRAQVQVHPSPTSTEASQRNQPIRQYSSRPPSFGNLIQEHELVLLNYVSEIVSGTAVVGFMLSEITFHHLQWGVDGITFGETQESRWVLVMIYLGQMVIHVAIHRLVLALRQRFRHQQHSQEHDERVDKHALRRFRQHIPVIALYILFTAIHLPLRVGTNFRHSGTSDQQCLV